MPLLIFIYSMIWQLICKYKPFWQEVSVEYVSYTQVTIKALGPLVAHYKLITNHLFKTQALVENFEISIPHTLTQWNAGMCYI